MSYTRSRSRAPWSRPLAGLWPATLLAPPPWPAPGPRRRNSRPIPMLHQLPVLNPKRIEREELVELAFSAGERPVQLMNYSHDVALSRHHFQQIAARRPLPIRSPRPSVSRTVAECCLIFFIITDAVLFGPLLERRIMLLVAGVSQRDAIHARREERDHRLPVSSFPSSAGVAEHPGAGFACCCATTGPRENAKKTIVRRVTAAILSQKHTMP